MLWQAAEIYYSLLFITVVFLLPNQRLVCCTISAEPRFISEVATVLKEKMQIFRGDEKAKREYITAKVQHIRAPQKSDEFLNGTQRKTENKTVK